MAPGDLLVGLLEEVAVGLAREEGAGVAVRAAAQEQQIEAIWG